MNKSDKLITLPQAKELHELCKEKGIVLMESEYCWTLVVKDYDKSDETEWIITKTKKRNKFSIPAHCCAELGEILSNFKYQIQYNKKEFALTVDLADYPLKEILGRTELNESLKGAMCAMLIYLLKNNLL